MLDALQQLLVCEVHTWPVPFVGFAAALKVIPEAHPGQRRGGWGGEGSRLHQRPVIKQRRILRAEIGVEKGSDGSSGHVGADDAAAAGANG